MTLWDRFFLEFAKAIVPHGYEVKQRGIGAQLFAASVLEDELAKVADIKFRDKPK